MILLHQINSDESPHCQNGGCLYRFRKVIGKQRYQSPPASASASEALPGRSRLIGLSGSSCCGSDDMHAASSTTAHSACEAGSGIKDDRLREKPAGSLSTDLDGIVNSDSHKPKD